MVKIKIIQDREGCIGCGSCAMLCPKFWEMDYNEGKAFLKGAKPARLSGGKISEKEYELEIDNIECNQDAADSCPVQIIKVISNE